jgi:hypothetical protein
MTVMSTGRVEFRIPVHVPTETTEFGQIPTRRKPHRALRVLLEFGPFLLAFDAGTTIDYLDVSARLIEHVRKSRSSARAAAILAGVARSS